MHCLRVANGVAHAIAKFAYDHDFSCSWVAQPSDFLVNVLVHDVTITHNQ